MDIFNRSQVGAKRPRSTSNASMKSIGSIFLWLIVAGGGALRADPEQPPPASIRQELRDAEKASSQRIQDADKSRHETLDLTQSRDLWSRELADVKIHLTAAQAELAAVKKRGEQVEIDRWTFELAGWEARAKAAAVELKTIDDRSKAADHPMQARSHEEDLLVAGDTLELVIVEDTSFNGIYPVRRGGYILIPRVGRVFVAGKDLEGAERAIQESLVKNQILPAAKVIAERSQGSASVTNSVIFLAGEFEKPGPWQIPPGSIPTLLTTILQSGGVSQKGDLSQVRLLRLIGGRQLVETFDVRAMLSGTNFSADIPIRANDIVVVPARSNEVFITGNVKTPGPIRLVPGEDLRAYSAILKSGGFSRFADEKKVYILREGENGAKEKIPVNVKEVKRGQGADLKLQARDIVVVPERFFSL